MPKPLFSPTLLEEFPWVIYNESSGTLGCSLCSKHAIRRTTFALGMFSVTGSEAGRSFRRSDLSPHEKSAVHIRAAQLESGQGDAEMLPEDGDADVPIVIQARRTTSGGRGGSKDRPLTGTADASPTEDVEYSPGSPLQTTVSSSHLVIAHALPPHWKSLVASWLEEDAPGFDIGGYIVGETKQKAILYGKAPGVLAGVPFFNHVFEQVGCKVEWFIDEGASFEVDSETGRTKIAQVKGPARQLLLGERPALNALARASGIATRARRLADLKTRHNWHGWIAGTRKTTPGFRIVEKYAMLVGGVDPHRYDHSSMVMLKDNHIWATGSITNAVKAARSLAGFSVKIEVECRTEAEASLAIVAGADIVMLDNFGSEELKECAAKLKSRFASTNHFLIEGSGGLTEETASSYFSSDVDILSFGSLSQGVPHIDFSLKVAPKH